MRDTVLRGCAVTCLVVGGGPAGLMAAEEMARAGLDVLVVDAKPSFGRKFLMAGKSGLNLTKDEPASDFLSAYAEGRDDLRPMIGAFGPEDVKHWARGLGQPLFTGSTGRVFPEVMKASPLLRAWLARLSELGVEMRTRWRWTGWDDSALRFDTPEGPQVLAPDATVLALGGASWARLGSDGMWAPLLEQRGVDLAPFQPSNIGLQVKWSDHMTPHFGQPLKAVRWYVSTQNDDHGQDEAVSSRGEAIISERGLEGGGIYPLIPALRAGGRLMLDLAPDLNATKLAQRLSQSRKGGLSRALRNSLRWPPHKIALFHEFTKGFDSSVDGPDPAHVIKALPVRHTGLRPMDRPFPQPVACPFPHWMIG